MRPDTRSFSFTWLKGQKSRENQPPVEEAMEEEGGNDGWSAGRGSSASRLRRLGNSLARLGQGQGGSRYANMQNDETDFHQVSEEPLSLDESDEEEEGIVETMDWKVKGRPDVLANVPFRKQEMNVIVPPAPTSDEPAPSGLSLSKRLNKTVQGVKSSLGNFSQKFRKSTRRRYRMGPSTPGSVASPTRKILGRTPTKLYSPFGIDSPAFSKTPKRIDRPSTPRRTTRKSFISGLVYSPSNNFRRDLDDARRGMEDFHLLTRDITRRSVRF